MQQLEESGEHLSNLELDEWHAGELDAAARTRCEAHLAQCAHCRARRAQFAREASEFFAEAPNFVPPQRTPAPQPRAARLWFVGTLAALAAGIALIAWPASRGAGTRPKGAAHLDFFIKRGELVRRGESGEQVHPGDLLRFVYSAGEPKFLGVFGLDANGASVYFPNGHAALRVHPGNDVALDFSVELDAQLGTERVLGVFCPEPFALEPVRAALASSAPLPAAMSACAREQITLEKVAQP